MRKQLTIVALAAVLAIGTFAHAQSSRLPGSGRCSLIEITLDRVEAVGTEQILARSRNAGLTFSSMTSPKEDLQTI